MLSQRAGQTKAAGRSQTPRQHILCTLSAASRYSFGLRPSTGNSRPAGGCSWGSTRAAVAKAEMDMPCHADTICVGRRRV